MSIHPPRDRVTRHLSELAAGIVLNRLSAPTRRHASDALRDHVACVAGGCATAWGESALRAIVRWAGPGACTVIGAREALAPAGAAYANAQLGNMLDFDDTYFDLGHPGTTIIPAALAVAEREGHGTDALLAAVVAGYEVAVRFGAATRPSDQRFRVLYPTAWHGIGAAVAACCLLDPSAETITSAIGIAAEQVAAATAITTNTTYAFKSGKMGSYAAVGVASAYAAVEGLYGKTDALDEGTPYWRSFGSDRYDVDIALADSDGRFAIGEVSYKPYPSCRLTHTAVEAAQRLGIEYGREDVVELRVETFTRALQLAAPRPLHAAHGPFCLPHVIAVALLGIEETAWYSSDTLSDGEVRRIADLVKLTPSSRFDRAVDSEGAIPCRIEVSYGNGVVAAIEVQQPLGEPSRPMSDDDLTAKALTYLTSRIGAERAATAVSALIDLAHHERPTSTLTRLLSQRDPSGGGTHGV